MDRRAWQAHGVAKSRTRLSEHFLFFHSHLEEGRSGVKSLSRVRLFVTPWTVVHQAPLSIAFSTQEYWRGLPCPPPEDLPNPRIEPKSLASPPLAG